MERELEKKFNVYFKKLDRSVKTITFFTIINTAKKIGHFYFTPVRIFDGVQVCGVVVSNTLEARYFARIADGFFDYIAVDSEKKIEPDRYAYREDRGNIKGEVQNIIRKSKLIIFKANDVTVNAIEIFVNDKIMDLSAVTIAIVGAGNIGFKLALRLVERGCQVKMFRRNQEKLKIQADCINLVKPRGTLARVEASASLAETLMGSQVIIAVTDSSNSVLLNDLRFAAVHPLLIDCGKACFSPDVCTAHTVYRTDVGVALIYQLKMIVESERILHPKFGRKFVGDRTYVCGVSGVKGDIVVKDINNLASSIGVCDGDGGLISTLQ